ncbi:MAG: D-alanyl-D-alanine carboxypeptidase [Bacteroidetes bacterium]|nr:D-alanyl-D-alanine carboxypeptidase [Bacteroidota bacterium]MBS1931668.1 D-alanyl-D-alanine carboxypeptidase [Bacteroidota bacterium]
MKRRIKYFKQLFIINYSLFILAGCSVQKQISRSAQQVINDPSLATAHIGISIFSPTENKYWYNYQGDKYFTPASNTKLATCYAAMKYLGDSLVGILKSENDTAIFFLPAADPTLLHPDFKNQPVIDFFKNTNKKIYTTDSKWQSTALGSGWSWDDYDEDYMAERSPLPVYGNVLKWVQDHNNSKEPAVLYSDPEVDWKVDFNPVNAKSFSVKRNIGENMYWLTQGNEKYKELEVPFVTHGIHSALELLPDTIHKTIGLLDAEKFQHLLNQINLPLTPVKTQATDSLLKITMHRSDNFFAEQSLLMVSNKLLGVMSDEKIIDTLLKTDYKNLPQKPNWVDGSGLSRYDLFTPQDFVSILNKMKNEFGIERIKVILPTGNTGTLKNLYKPDSNYIFAKTGTLSGVVALSGYLYTKKNKLLIFSVLVNNHRSRAASVRIAVEKFIENIRNKY